MATLAPTRTHRMALAQLAAQDTLPLLSRVAIKVACVAFHWSQRRQTRTALKHLSEYQLRDIGLTRDEALTECAKPFWRP